MNGPNEMHQVAAVIQATRNESLEEILGEILKANFDKLPAGGDRYLHDDLADKSNMIFQFDPDRTGKNNVFYQFRLKDVFEQLFGINMRHPPTDEDATRLDLERMRDGFLHMALLLENQLKKTRKTE